MAGFTNRVSQGILNHITGKSALFSIPTAYVALFTVPGTDVGTGFTEVTGGSYTRVTTGASDWNSASGTAPSTITNANALTFPPATADWGIIVAFGLYDAVTSGNLMAWDWMGNFSWLPAFITSASPGVFDVKAHGYSVADSLIFSTEIAGTAPSFSQSNFTGTLVVAHAATDTFDVTNAATAVNTSSTGSGLVRKIAAQSIPNGVTANFASTALTIVSS